MTAIKYKGVLIIMCMIIALGKPQQTPNVRVSTGELRGVISPDLPFGYYSSYLGIPYAKADVRYQEAKAAHWDGVFEANNENVVCSQRGQGQEDCLTLNVYTPGTNIAQPELLTTSKPVMVFIHGGGFLGGSKSSNAFGPQYLLRYGVIVVSINYRLDIFGFLCLGIKEAPGNIGLKDQTQALKWVKENIRQFGGDPDNITIFGESAGSASVMYHLLSPLSKGLFHKAIMESASAASPWSFQFEPIKIASQLAKLMGYETEDPYVLYNIFMNKTPEQLLSTVIPRATGNISPSEFMFVPCAEKNLPNIQPFLNDTPYNIISNEQYAKVPMIIGYNSAEGYTFASAENDITIQNFNFYSSLPRDLKFPSEIEAITTANKLKELYTGNIKVSRDTLIKLADYVGDCDFIYPVIATADMIVKTNDKNTFLYKFEYSGLLNFMKSSSGFGWAPGATHGDELFYIFKPALSDYIGYQESDMIFKMTSMWTNFARFGNPTPVPSAVFQNWLPANKQNPSLFVINRPFSTSPLWGSEKLQFWNNTYALYRRH